MSTHRVRVQIRISLAIMLGIFVFFSSAFANSPVTHSKHPLPLFKASYTLKKGGIPVAEVRRQLKQATNGDYLFESYSKPIGVAAFFVKDIILERSRWQAVDGKFRPKEYAYERTGGKKNRYVTLKFDWKNNKVTNIINNDAWQMTVPGNVQDKLLYQLSVMADLHKPDKVLNYEVADGGRLKDYSFEVLANEVIPTEVGRIETIKIRRQDKKRTITIWCARKYHYLPVRIEQNDKDGEFDLYIDTVTGF